jgi:putative flippase GtrA
MFLRRKNLQIIRFAAVGLISNIILYMAYLLLTAAGLGYKVAMSLLFVVGVLQTFIFNNSWTFSNETRIQSAFVKYIAVYVLAYAFNLAALMFFVDWLNFPHEVIQVVAIVIISACTFIVQRRWVFQ